MSATPEEKFYRVRKLPQEVAEELRRAAAANGVGVRRAFLLLLEHLDLDRAVAAGRKRLPDFDGAPLEAIGMHLTDEQRERVRDAGRRLLVEQGQVGTLLLLSRSGRLEESVRRAKAAAARVA